MPAWVQPSWPQVQIISTLLPIPSQWALQYFSLSGAMQLHAGFAHFLLELAIRFLPGPERAGPQLPLMRIDVQRMLPRRRREGRLQAAAIS